MFRRSHSRILQGMSNAGEDVSATGRLSAKPHLLFLSHCVPSPPNKGEKIRAHYEISHLARDYQIHLACFARTEDEMGHALTLRDRCASVYVELLPFRTTLLRAAYHFASGECLTAAFHRSRRFRAHLCSLESLPLRASFVYSSVMAQYAPAGVPMLLDMVDVDSEKWLEYGQSRRLGPVYSVEGRRLRDIEKQITARAQCTVVSTHQEKELMVRNFSAESVITVENGVDFDFYDPQQVPELECLRGRQFLLFVGAMNYYPNADAVQRFAREVFGRLRRTHPQLEFLIVGHNPAKAVRALSRNDGITVTGSVPDVRPYLAAARAVVAPLRIARGMQNKVLEGLAMGRVVLATSAVCRTFGTQLPHGVICCDHAEDYEKALAIPEPERVRRAAQARFNWATNVGSLEACLGRLDAARRAALPFLTPQ